MARAVYGGIGKQTRSPVGSGRYTASSNPTPSGVPQGSPGGTLGGIGIMASGSKPGARLMIGDEGYVWLLIAIEVGVMFGCRRHFRRYHGG